MFYVWISRRKLAPFDKFDVQFQHKTMYANQTFFFIQ